MSTCSFFDSWRSLLAPETPDTRQLRSAMDAHWASLRSPRDLSKSDIDAVKYRVITRLPRELRDRVYAYLWDDHTSSKFRYTAHLPGSRYCHISKGKIPEFLRQKQDGNDASPRSSFSGQFDREAVDFFYTAVLNNPELTFPHEDVGFFLHHDVFGVGLTPGEVPLRALTIVIDLTRGEYGRYHYRHPPSKVFEESRMLKESLVHLVSTKRRADFTLTLRFESVGMLNSGLEDLADFFLHTRVIAPVIRNLDRLGMDVWIELEDPFFMKFPFKGIDIACVELEIREWTARVRAGVEQTISAHNETSIRDEGRGEYTERGYQDRDVFLEYFDRAVERLCRQKRDVCS